jgi:CTP:molybdopterin cytidylyltransferase MocA
VAGGVPQKGDPLYPYARPDVSKPSLPKTLIDIGGKPMVQWVMDALTEAESIERIVIVGLDPPPHQGGQEGGRADASPSAASMIKATMPDGYKVHSPKVVAQLPDQGSMLENAVAGGGQLLAHNPTARQIVFSNADIPTITGEMVDAFVAQCRDPEIDIYYSVVPRAVMDARFPRAGRSYVHFTESAVAGGDMGVINPHIFDEHRALFEDLTRSRKIALKQALRLGLGFFVKLYFKRLSIAEVERRVPQKLGLRVRVVRVAHAELGMDVDKPSQLEICRQRLR